MFEVVDVFELIHMELRPVEAFFHVFGVAVGVGEEVLELDEVVLFAFGIVEHLSAAVDSLGAVFSGHIFLLDRVVESCGQKGGIIYEKA